MSKTKPLLQIIFILLFFSIHNFADGWTQKKGEGYFSLDYRILSGSKYHDNTGVNIVIPKLTDMAFNFYGEFGLTNDLTIIANFPFYKILKKDISFKQEIFGQEEKNSGIGDLDLAFRYKIKTFGQTTISASLLFGLPLSKETNNTLLLGDGEFNQAFGFELGHSLYPLPAYISGGIKFNNRNNGYSDQLYYSFEGGYSVINNLLFIVRLHAIQSLHNGEKNNSIRTLLFANNQQFIAYKFSALYNLTNKLGVSASFESGIIAYNIQSAPVFTIGFFYKY